MKYKLIGLYVVLILIIYYFDKNTKKKVFLTYGNDRFKKSRKRIINEAKSLNIFDKHILETDKTIINDMEFKKQLENDNFKKVYESKKGGGYWIWKPYILYKHLSKLNDGDILVYCDAGCEIQKEPVKFNKIFNDFIHGKYNVFLSDISYNNGQFFSEKMWTKGDVLKYHNVYDNDKVLNENQIECGKVYIIKNNNSMKFITKLWSIAKNNPELFDDSESKIKNKDEFKEHRHDQSNMSILCKLYDECGIIKENDNPLKAKRIKG